MSVNFLTAAAIALLCAAATGAYWLQYARRRRTLFRWVNENDYRLVEYSSAFLTEATPFFFTASKAQSIFRVSVITRDGKLREGWVRFGGWWGGDAADVRWDP
jgi:hypothetical protein